MKKILMWELIEANKRRSWIIFIGMGLCLLCLGYIIGALWAGFEGGIIGLIMATGLWVALSSISYFKGDSLILSTSKAKEVTHDVHPQLFNIIEEMKIAASLPVRPKIYIINDPAPNAFATGRNPKDSSIAVTAGLLAKLNRDELEGVIAHEMSHIMNRDILYVTFAGVMLGSIILISEIFLRSLWYSGGSTKRFSSGGNSRDNGQSQLIIALIAITFAILAPILARLLYFALSRKREYLADASGVRLTRYPEGLASALEKISRTDLNLESASKVTAPMYIVNPFKRKGRGLIGLTGLFNTHPPTIDRIRILRSMGQGASYVDYEKAFSAVRGEKAPFMPPSALGDSEKLSIRKASIETEKIQGTRENIRATGDLMRAVNNYAFLPCNCGLKIKVPPELKREKIACPRCGNELNVPLGNGQAQTTVLSAPMTKTQGTDITNGENPVQESEPQVYTRQGRGWESFSCPCGKLLQISPIHMSDHINCSACGRKILIKNQA